MNNLNNFDFQNIFNSLEQEQKSLYSSLKNEAQT
jgi:hypothetical protein